ncbi:aspartate-semialdehyde dehydrogenase [Alicycliphilus sp. B1]|nr:aspartate-semialdehyde dehydrogenase [Alicycliphilus sp. B1]
MEGPGRSQQDPGHPATIPVDGLCVRIGAMRCHSLALTLKLKRDLPLAEIESLIKGGNPWVKFVANDKALTLQLTPPPSPAACRSAWPRAQAQHGARVRVGLRDRRPAAVGGAAEPLRRMLRILLGA